MSVDWTEIERDEISRGIQEHDLQSGAARPSLGSCTGSESRRMLPHAAFNCGGKGAARFLVPRKPHIPYWNAHVYVETAAHAVDAVTGPEGHAAATYVEDHWQWCDKYETAEVDVALIDPGIEDSR